MSASMDMGAFAMASASRKLSNVSRLLAERVPQAERTNHILAQTRTHEVLTQTDVEEAKQELHDAIEPQIESIVLKAERGLALFQVMEREMRQAVTLKDRVQESEEDIERLEQLRVRKETLLKEIEALRS